ncbi:MAG: glycoside hydrolase family 3 N-terminal domain-containing protein [Pseudomonadota bacterium]
MKRTEQSCDAHNQHDTYRPGFGLRKTKYSVKVPNAYKNQIEGNMYRTKATTNHAISERELKNRDVAYRAAIEGIVLLENNGALPMNSQRVALYGAGATHTVKGGTGSGEVNERHSISIMEGLQDAQIAVSSDAWIADYANTYDQAIEKHRKLVSRKMFPPTPRSMMSLFESPFTYPQGRKITSQDIEASATDTCIYVVTRQAGEGADRKLDNGDHTLTEVERANLIKCAAAYDTCIVIINVGSSFDVSFYEEIPGIDALVFFVQQGSEGGRALADILTGKVTPSGKLADTWARRYQDIPFWDEYSYQNGDLYNEQYKEGIYVGYRYFDTFEVEPLYPFGFGLSYTNFSISDSQVTVNGDQATLSAKVTNIGDANGKEVVQLYISCPQTGPHKPYQQLAGFAKTSTLSPGQSETVTIEINLNYLASYIEDEASFVLDAGDYVIRVGNASRSAEAVAVLSLDARTLVSRHANICPQTQRVTELEPEKVPLRARESELPTHQISSRSFQTVEHQYGDEFSVRDGKVDQIVSELSRDQLIDLVSGTGIGSIFFGEGHFVAPGSVGQTTSNLTAKGLINATMADGPAGLRLNRTTVFDKKGKAKMVEPVIEMLRFLPDYMKRFVFAKPGGREVYYQYATAFPVALALAQTWNSELIHEVGEAIGTEMIEYGIMFWLGPGMNIHRNPLCGRNFEYFSEDPFLSGKLAAAITAGCQSVGGVYATLKHFVANNQEDNRFKTSANLSERALREIYLRGFEIAVREAAPKAVMTAYNKVNNVYAPNSHDLLTKVLRDEWGFDGVVMTDWTATNKGLADNGACMTAGNDLLMPGGKYYRKDLLRSLEAGEITDEDVRKCARNIITAILNSALSKEYAPQLAAAE